MRLLIPILIGMATALVVTVVVLTVLLLVYLPRGAGASTVASFFPNVLRLLRRLYRDPAVPRSARWRLWVAIIYNIQPINLIPDFVPVIGFADNVVVTAWALRGAVHKAGPGAVTRNWQGTRDQLNLLFRVARLGPLPEDTAGPGESGAGELQAAEPDPGEMEAAGTDPACPPPQVHDP